MPGKRDKDKKLKKRNDFSAHSTGVFPIMQRRYSDDGFEHFTEVERIIPADLPSDLRNAQIGIQQQSRRFPQPERDHIFLRRQMKTPAENPVKMNAG